MTSHVMVITDSTVKVFDVLLVYIYSSSICVGIGVLAVYHSCFGVSLDIQFTDGHTVDETIN